MPDETEMGASSAEINETLRQILRWVRFQSLERVRQILEKEVAQDPKRILVYELTDGDKGRPEVSKISGVPSSTIQVWWDRWYSLGLLEPSSKRKGMVRKLCGIQEVGLAIPNELKPVLQGKATGTTLTPATTAGEPKSDSD